MKKFNFLQAILMVPLILAALSIQFACSKKIDVQKVPAVTTNVITGITARSATSGGNVTSDGGATVTAKGVCWSTAQKPDTSKAHTSNGAGTGAFLSDLEDLTPNTTYYVMSYAINIMGTAYGNEVTFTTLPSQFICGDLVTYEGKTYRTILIDSQCWFQENLNVGTRINGSVNQTDNGLLEKHCYNDEESNCDFYGGLYQWDEMMQYVTTNAQGICPSGWHIPTDADWTTLTDYLGGESVAGGKMKEAGFNNWASPNTGATNSSGFSAFGAGNHSDVGFDYIMRYAFFWSSSQDNAGPGFSWSRTPDYTSEELYRGSGNKGNSFSVRCLHD